MHKRNTRGRKQHASDMRDESAASAEIEGVSEESQEVATARPAGVMLREMSPTITPVKMQSPRCNTPRTRSPSVVVNPSNIRCGYASDIFSGESTSCRITALCIPKYAVGPYGM